jgi:hypothetical protein
MRASPSYDEARDVQSPCDERELDYDVVPAPGRTTARTYNSFPGAGSSSRRPCAGTRADAVWTLHRFYENGQTTTSPARIGRHLAYSLCHNGRIDASFRKRGANTPPSSPTRTAINCERCHGPACEHVARVGARRITDGGRRSVHRQPEAAHWPARCAGSICFPEPPGRTRRRPSASRDRHKNSPREELSAGAADHPRDGPGPIRRGDGPHDLFGLSAQADSDGCCPRCFNAKRWADRNA